MAQFQAVVGDFSKWGTAMCGIAGILDWHAPPDLRALNLMTGALAHRGPDASAVSNLGAIALGHRRLSVIDLNERANQPMQDSASGAWIVFNGEVYNYKEIRKELEAKGVLFNTESDTEVVLKAYVEFGADCLEKLNGMFALAIWDNVHQHLFLARDRAGEKPLYYAWLPSGAFVFASELQALRKHPALPNIINASAIRDFLTLNYISQDHSIVKGVNKLPPAHYLLIKRGKACPDPVEYWDLAAHYKNKSVFCSENEAVEALDHLFEDSVRLRLGSDVPLGSFLSGGIDSSAITAAIMRLRPASQNQTFSIGFSEPTYSELTEARSVATILGSIHQDLVVNADMATELPKIVRAADEPFADTSIIPFYFLAELARRDVTVCLSGDGGDELFAGYETYLADRFRHWSAFLPKGLTCGLARLLKSMGSVSLDKVSADYKLRQFFKGHGFDFPQAHLSWRHIHSAQERNSLLRPEHVKRGIDLEMPGEEHFNRVAGCHYLDQAMYVDTKTWLPDDILVKVDRATMAHSLESRAPFLDHRLMEFAASLPVDLKLKGLRKKHILKQSQQSYLPLNVIDRSKKGFNAPVSHWLNGELGALAHTATTSMKMKEWFDGEAIDRLWMEHRTSRRDNGLKLFGLTCLGLWLDLEPQQNPAGREPSAHG
jgi:asparagine synthase (glutamine-hydrolysing)